MPGRSLCLLALVALCCSEEPARDATPASGHDAAAGSGGSSGSSAGSAGSASADASSGSGGSAGSTGSGGAAAPDASGDASDAARRAPGDLLDLTDWKLTLPVGEIGNPTEIMQPELRHYSLDPLFLLNRAGDGVVFQAPVSGATTANSSYPRTELREMTNQGAEEAAWSTFNGIHELYASMAITHLPVEKPHIVAAQIHDASDDVIMVRLEGEHLFVESGGEEIGDLNPSYSLGTRFTLVIRAAGGRISVNYEDTGVPKVDIESVTEGCYFKIGAYTQSNPSRGDAPSAYGEVVVYDLSVTHREVSAAVHAE